MVKLIYYTLDSKFGVLKSEMHDSVNDAFWKAKEYGRENGFTNIRQVDDDDFTIRVTATTPNGRAGRNIAAIEQGYDQDFA
jgi:hypothetical protein